MRDDDPLAFDDRMDSASFRKETRWISGKRSKKNKQPPELLRAADGWHGFLLCQLCDESLGEGLDRVCLGGVHQISVSIEGFVGFRDGHLVG